jgi:LacI family transcriptional regulator
VPKSTTNKAKVTISDIAHKSGVSPATVSLVLRNKPGVGAKTRQRVFDSAQALGYIHTPSNQSQEQNSIKNIGLVVKAHPDDIPEVNSFYVPVLVGIEAVCRKNQINLMYASIPVDEHNNPIETPRLLTEQHTEGLLLVGMQVDTTLLSVLRRQDVPAVLVDAYASGDPYDAVVSDNIIGAQQAVNYLVENGHRHIAIAGSETDAYPSIRERRTGYLQTIEEHGLIPYFADCALWPGCVKPVITQTLQQHPEITAVFACNDDIAIAVISAAEALGKQIPEDLSIIGFDNIVLAQHVTPPLTTMRVDKIGMGRLAAQTLLNRIEYPEAGWVRSVIIPTLIERQTVHSL